MANQRIRLVRDGGRAVPSADSLQNLAMGLGDPAKDKMVSASWLLSELSKQQLDAAYRTDWIARKIVDIPAFDATREWRNWQADPSDITELEDAEKALLVQRKTMLTLQKARLYGGGAMIMGINQGTPDQEINIEQIKQGDLQWVHSVSRWDLGTGPMELDVTSPYFGEPQYYTRTMPNNGQTLRLHPSRVVRFVGMELPDLNISVGWGDSVLQIVKDAVQAAGVVVQGGAQLVNEAKIDVIKIPGLSENISSKAYETKLKDRFGAANMIKSLYSLLLLDKEEEWQRIEQTFASFDDVMKMYLLVASGAGDIPATRMLGQSPAGLSATGDADTRNYYDRVSTAQKIEIAPNLNRLDQVFVRSVLGTYPDGLHFNWAPLWQMSDADKADIAVKKATVMTADVNAGLIDPLVMQKARENQLIEDGTYPGLEDFIEEFGTDINERDVGSNEPILDPITGQWVDPVTGDLIEVQQKAPAGPAAALPGGNAPAQGGAAKNVPNPPATSDAMPPRKRKGRYDRVRLKRQYGDRLTTRAKRVRLGDATPRTLYVSRQVLNARDIIKWAKSNGFDTTLLPADMHVTVAYVKKEIDWLKVGTDSWCENDDGSLSVKPGGPRMMEAFGPDKKAAVLVFSNSPLQYRNMCIQSMVNGEGIDYPDYNPHITLTYNSKFSEADLLAMQAYTGPIELGPEIFEEVGEGDNSSEYEEA